MVAKEAMREEKAGSAESEARASGRGAGCWAEVRAAPEARARRVEGRIVDGVWRGLKLDWDMEGVWVMNVVFDRLMRSLRRRLVLKSKKAERPVGGDGASLSLSNRFSRGYTTGHCHDVTLGPRHDQDE